VTQYLNAGTQVFNNVNLRLRGNREDRAEAFSRITADWIPPNF
jgi:hypothetical protein